MPKSLVSQALRQPGVGHNQRGEPGGRIRVSPYLVEIILGTIAVLMIMVIGGPGVLPSKAWLLVVRGIAAKRLIQPSLPATISEGALTEGRQRLLNTVCSLKDEPE